MYVFVDESGDAGLNIAKGSSKLFVVACCVFSQPKDVEEAAEKIRSLRSELKWHQKEEFKFSKTRLPVQLQFLELARTFDFFVRSIVIDKSSFSADYLRPDKNSFYNFAIQQVLADSIGTISNAKLLIDGKAPREYVSATKKYFNSQLKSGEMLIDKLKFVDSKGDQLIQLADMVAGAIRRSHDYTRFDQDVYREVLRPIKGKPSSNELYLGK